MNKKIPLIQVPGLLCDDALWEFQVSELGDVADCTVANQHLHHDTIDRIAEAIGKEAPPRFALAGLSMGGYIALEICRKFSERVDRLALIDTSARAETPEQTERREGLMSLCRQGRFKSVTELLYPLLVHSVRADDAVLKRKIIDMGARVGPDIFIRQQKAIIGRRDQVPNLTKITCATVIICGEQDQITPLACSREIATHVPHAKLEILRDCGHMSSMEKPDKVSEILLHWLASPYPS